MMSCHICNDEGVLRGDGFPRECDCQDGWIEDDFHFTASNDLQWQPGSPGKGVVLEDGSVWTWPIDEETRAPWHMEKSYKFKQKGLESLKVNDALGTPVQAGGFEIDPDGSVHRLHRPLPPELLEPILASDPNLKNPDEDPWRLSKVIPEERWLWIG